MSSDRDKEDVKLDGRKLAEARADAEINDWIYAQSRLVIRSKGGMISTRDAIEAVRKDPQIKNKLLAHIASHDYDFYLRFKADPKKAIAYLDAQIAESESPD